IKAAVAAGGKVILMSHLGRPKGEAKPEMSLAPAAKRLGELLGKPVKLAPDCVGPEVAAVVSKMADGDVVVLENLRFHKGEEKSDPEFIKQLASLGDVYVNDAFGTSHRKHASMYGVPSLLPKGSRAIGFLVQKELQFLGDALTEPKRPFVAILGGAKVSDKIGVIENLSQKVDVLLIGGAMSYTFMRAKGQGTGKSKVEAVKENKDGSKTNVIALAKDLLAKLESAKAELVLPVDHLVVQEFDESSPTAVQAPAIKDGWMGVDIGPKTIDLYKKKLAGAGTVVWNGPMGVFEKEPWATGTKAVCAALADLKGATTVIGGGDSAAAVAQFGYADKMSHISTGGGASLEFLEGKGFACLDVIDEA
ncbi:MAG: phosphoglycerate kinase, partial [Planctomycetes bacterium]|nr:phosphoglycerate kinase [Planctomycetota bacterium]